MNSPLFLSVQAFLTIASEALVILDPQGCCLEANALACEMLGLSPGNVQNHRITEFWREPATGLQAWHDFLGSFALGSFALERLADGSGRTELGRTELGRTELGCTELGRTGLGHIEAKVVEGSWSLLGADGVERSVTYRAIAHGQPRCYLVALAAAQLEIDRGTPNPTAENPMAQHPKAQNGLAILDCRDCSAVEQALHETELKYRTLFEILPIGVSITDAQGNVIESNPASEQILGLPSEDHNRRTCDEPTWQIIRPDLSPMPAQEYPAVRALQENCAIEGVEQGIVRADQTVRWIMTSAAPIPLSRYGVAIAYVDITDRKAIEAELQTTRDHYHLVLSSVGEGIWEWDCETDRVNASPRYWRILGEEQPAEVDVSADSLRDRIHPNDVPGVMAWLQAHLSQRLPYRPELRLRHRAGHYIWIRTRGQAIWDDQGRPIRMIGTIEDISDRKAAEAALIQREQEFRTLAENSPDCIMRCDRQFRFTYVNPTVLDLSGIPLSMFLGKTAADLGFPPNLVELWHRAMAQVFQTGCETSLEYTMLLSDGLHTFDSRVVPERNPEYRPEYRPDLGAEAHVGDRLGQGTLTKNTTETTETNADLVGVLIVARDITVLKAAQSALLHQAERERTLRLIAQQIRQSLDLADVLAAAVTEVQRTLQADRTLIFQLCPDGSGLVIQEAVKPPYPSTLNRHWSQECFPADCYAAYCERQVRIVQDVVQDAWGDCLREFMEETAVKSKIVAPIPRATVGEDTVKLWGLLIVHACEDHRSWQEDEADLLQQVADQLAIAIDHSELLDRLSQQSQALRKANEDLAEANAHLSILSHRDGLTQIANRRCFDETVSQEWQRLCRLQEPLSIILFDVDHFKRYNDLHGHPAGDECLIQIARAVDGLLKRSADLVARYGGEEFVVLLPHVDVLGAAQIAEQIRQAIRSLNLPHSIVDRQQHYVTVSLGVASQVPQQDSSLQNLIGAADQALYQAKSLGRNTWVAAASDRCREPKPADLARQDAKIMKGQSTGS